MRFFYHEHPLTTFCRYITIPLRLSVALTNLRKEEVSLATRNSEEEKILKNKKAFLAILIVLVMVFTVGSIGVGASYVDSGKITGNSFEAGSLVLQVGESESLPFALSNIKPGDNGVGVVTLTNTGSIAGKLSMDWTKTIDDENGILAPEAKQYPRPLGGPGLTTGDYEGNGGELDIFLQFAPYVDLNSNRVFDSGDIQLAYNGQFTAYPGYRSGNLYWSGLNSYGARWTDIKILAAGASVDIVIPWRFPTETTDNNYHQNMSMTDSLGFDAEFVLAQP